MLQKEGQGGGSRNASGVTREYENVFLLVKWDQEVVIISDKNI